MAKETLKGLAKTLKALEKYGEKVNKQVDAITQANAREIEVKAKQRAPVDLGKLRQSIGTVKRAEKSYSVVANAPYAAYQEFGTGNLVSVPPELADIAIQFRGRGVKQVNIPPQPFLFPSFVSQRPQYLKDLDLLLESESKKV